MKNLWHETQKEIGSEVPLRSFIHLGLITAGNGENHGFAFIQKHLEKQCNIKNLKVSQIVTLELNNKPIYKLSNQHNAKITLKNVPSIPALPKENKEVVG